MRHLISGAPSPFGPIERGAPDLATNGLFQYGVYEGIPRILDLMDKHQVKITSFMIGQAVDKAPDLAREIVRRGHEAAAHGRTWQNSNLLDPDAERRFITDGVESPRRLPSWKYRTPDFQQCTRTLPRRHRPFEVRPA